MELKRFQRKVVDKLLYFTSPNYNKDTFVLKSPTGSGKTIMLLSWIDKYIQNTDDNIAFVWFTPGAGELEEQSENKAKKFFNSAIAQSIDDSLNNGFLSGSVTFINYEKVVGKKSKAMLTDSEQDNLVDNIRMSSLKGTKFIVIVDEAHRNDTKKARNIIAQFNAVKTVRVSATIDNPNDDSTEFEEVTEQSVIDSGLITSSVIVNEGIDLETKEPIEFAPLFDAAEQKRKLIIKSYNNMGIFDVNPLVLVQLPDDYDSKFYNRVESYMNNTMKKTYKNGKLGVWLSDYKRNISGVSDLNNNVEYLIIKQAIATGWDAPRAKILIKLRENMDEQFTIQTIGRIRRMPKPLIGNNGLDIVNNSYLYTFDVKFLDGAFKQGNVFPTTPILHLKNKAKNIELSSERSLNNDEIVNEREIRSNIFNGLKNKFNFNDNPDENKIILENNGYNLDNKIQSSFKQGRFDTISNSDNLNNHEIYVKANFNDNSIDLTHIYNWISQVIRLKPYKVKELLEIIFSCKSDGKYSILNLDGDNYAAFIINNKELLFEEFKRIDVSVSIQGSLDIANVKFNDFSIPLNERYKYKPSERNPKIVYTNAYENYTDEIINARPSSAERFMERFIEDNNSLFSFVYKNGDKGSNYFSIVYGNNGGISHFYPDFIIKDNNGSLYIIETKGGKNSKGEDKNIDPYAPAKYEALKRYSLKNNLKWAFVRDMNEKLFYLNDGAWTDDMKDSSKWKPIDELFN